MKSMLKRETLREIKGSFGRYFAILAIVALGVGFFSGLKVAKPLMTTTADQYLKEQNLFDLRLLSTLGFEQEDVDSFAQEEGVKTAAGSLSFDVLCSGADENALVLKTHSLTEGVNGVSLKAGRMPENEGECVADSRLMGEEQLGTVITLTDGNEEDTLEVFKEKEFTVVGIVDSSYYINFERGTSSLGSGRVAGYIYLLPQAFDCDYYTEVFIKFDHDYEIYSDEYEDFMDRKTDEWEDICKERVDDRYQEILTEANDKLSDAREELETQKADAQEELSDAFDELTRADEQIEEGRQALLNSRKQLEASGLKIPEMLEELDKKEEELNAAEQETEKGWQDYEEARLEFEEKIADAEKELDDARKEIDDIEEPDYYVLGRNTNVGYVCFENDSDIVAGIADLFPVFFFMVAALVCITTMNRMVEEQRTQIGVLKALGYTERAIMGRFMFYSGSAALIGCAAGYVGGTIAFPKVIWTAYSIMYNMPGLLYRFDGELAILSVIVSLFCSIGATWFSCRYELLETAANLMRPKAPKAGKRVFLEKVPFIWKRLKFLQKVSVRNIVRYKKRFFMMVIGISGCTALLVTGLGLKDSVTGLASQQFDGIQISDGSISLKEAVNPEKETAFDRKLSEVTENYTYVCEESWDLVHDGSVKSLNMVVLERPEEIGDYLNLHTVEDTPIPYPEEGQAVINNKIADNYHIEPGEEIIIRNEDMQEITVTVSGIFENFVYNYIIIAPETYLSQLHREPEYKSVYVNYKEELDIHEAAAAMMSQEGVSSVTVNQDTKERFDNMLGSMNYVVLLVILCAAALAFIVLYNLTNINITERIREIATIKVLGFYKKETASYVFRENMILTAIGAGVGLILGYFLHGFIMSRINVDMVSFDVYIRPVSYLYSILLTFVFNFLVNRVMAVKLEKINMAESLKSVD
ncbi:MAG: FtsX-like permease family protein [Suilimivivens sp.]